MEEKNNQIVSTMSTQSLIQDLRQIIEQARGQVAATANYAQTMMYWHIGERINREVLDNKRAEYGKQSVATVARQLQEEFGRKGFDEKSIRTQKGQSPLCTAISGKPDEFIKKELSTLRNDNVMSPDLVFKSPYFLEFTGLKGFYSEKSLEDCLLAHLEQFIIELGNGFSFVARQKRMIIDGEDFYLDLLFYHRRLHRLIAIDLKKGRFKAEYKGQMELYLRWLEQNEMEPGEETPLGLLLCTEGSEEQIELLQLDKAGIKVAQYLTELPPRHVLMQQIQKSLEIAKARFDNYCEEEDV